MASITASARIILLPTVLCFRESIAAFRIYFSRQTEMNHNWLCSRRQRNKKVRNVRHLHATWLRFPVKKLLWMINVFKIGAQWQRTEYSRQKNYWSTWRDSGSKNSYVMQFYEINVCLIMIFRIYTV